jgi:hypothetical protein
VPASRLAALGEEVSAACTAVAGFRMSVRCLAATQCGRELVLCVARMKLHNVPLAVEMKEVVDGWMAISRAVRAADSKSGGAAAGRGGARSAPPSPARSEQRLPLAQTRAVVEAKFHEELKAFAEANARATGAGASAGRGGGGDAPAREEQLARSLEKQLYQRLVARNGRCDKSVPTPRCYLHEALAVGKSLGIARKVAKRRLGEAGSSDEYAKTYAPYHKATVKLVKDASTAEQFVVACMRMRSAEAAAQDEAAAPRKRRRSTPAAR